MNIAELLDVESDPAFLRVSCPTTGILAWPAIRNEFMRLVIGDHFYPSAPLADLHPRRNWARIAVGAARAAAHNARHPPRRADVLFVGTGSGLIPQDGRSFNRYIDYFAQTVPGRSWTMEWLYGGAWPRLPRSNDRLGYLADRRVIRELQGRVAVRKRHHELMGALIDLAESRARTAFEWDIGDARRATLREVGARRLASYPDEARHHRRLLRRVRPRIAIVEEGAYGRMAVFNATARDLGVVVAEFQHGMVTRGHDAYNVAPGLRDGAAYERTQPHAFLAYGDWWNEQFNAPIRERVPIGNPHRSETLRGWTEEQSRSKVIVIGDGVETEAHLELCTDLAMSARGDLQIVFRPHPRERHRVPAAARRFGIDVEPDLYKSLASARAVLSEASTVLFEAIGLVSTVLAWDTPKSRFYLGDHSIERFETAAQALALIERVSENPDSVGVDAVWAEGWKGRFLDFIDRRA